MAGTWGFEVIVKLILLIVILGLTIWAIYAFLVRPTMDVFGEDEIISGEPPPLTPSLTCEVERAYWLSPKSPATIAPTMNFVPEAKVTESCLNNNIIYIKVGTTLGHDLGATENLAVIERNDEYFTEPYEFTLTTSKKFSWNPLQRRIKPGDRVIYEAHICDSLGTNCKKAKTSNGILIQDS